MYLLQNIKKISYLLLPSPISQDIFEPPTVNILIEF